MARRLALLAILPLALVLGLSVVLIAGDDCEDGASANPGTLSPEAKRAIPHDIAEIYVAMARRWNIDVAFLASIGAQETDHGRIPTTNEVNGSGPVRAGNDAHGQLQLDALGQLVEQSWAAYERGQAPDDDWWRFISELVDEAVERWREPDCGLWEWRGEPRHFVHSKALCWAAADRGLRLADACMRKARERRWRRARDEIREAIDTEGYDDARGVFVQCFGARDLDAALLRLPAVGFVAWDDERMVRTADAIVEELGEDGLLYRYRRDNGLAGEEATFVPCAFWLARCLAEQGRTAEARSVFDRAVGTASPLGLFSEEYDPGAGEMLGNFPQALSHLSHIEAALAL
jgi:GH15 family glucan-1,4-alpha-glucosidase